MPSGLGVSLDVKYLCSFHLFPSWRLWSVWRVFVTVCMVMVSVVFEGLRQVMCSLCRDSVSSFWCLWVSIWAAWSLCVRNKTSYVLGCEVSVRKLRVWKLADMIRGLEPHMLTVCCWPYQLSPGISVCIILIQWGQYTSCRVPVHVSVVCKGPGFRLSFSKCFLSTCHIPEHYWRSLGQDRTDHVSFRRLSDQ